MTLTAPVRLYSWGNNLSVLRNTEHLSYFQLALHNPNSPQIAIGAGNSYGDCAFPVQKGLGVYTRKNNKIIEFDKNTGEILLEAGVNFGQIIKFALPHGYFPPVTPGTQYVSIGGAIASNVHGKNHHIDGSIENFVKEIVISTANGDFVCSPTENQPLFKASLGGYGLTGIIKSVRINLKPVNSGNILQKTIKTKSLRETLDILSRENGEFYYSVGWIDTNSKGRHFGRGCIYLGKHQNSAGSISKSPLTLSPGVRQLGKWARFPVLNNWTIPQFSKALFTLSREGEKDIHWLPYFYPLDTLLIWNRLYGKNGLIQYQACIPDPHGEAGIEELLAKSQGLKLASFISILKRCGNDKNTLPFCKKGYTLALDFPNQGDAIKGKLAELDKIVLKYNGKIYLTKDSRLPSETFKEMYPEYKNWVSLIKKYNPSKNFNSEMAERLKIWDM